MAGEAQLAPPEYAPTPVWGYEGVVPGPLLRIRQGERLRRRFVNLLDQPSTVHWHGVRIANGMDGVAGLTQDGVPPGGEFEIDFRAPDAGTFWYHSHERSWEQVARGLYGALVVEEADPPDADLDETLLLDDWRLDTDAALHESFGSLHDWAHDGRIGNWSTVNGTGEYRRAVRHRQRLRLRLVNAATARIFDLALDGMHATAVALDGQPLAAPFVAQRLRLAPAQRVDLIADVLSRSGEARLLSAERDAVLVLARFPVSGSARDRFLPSPPPLPANSVPDPTSASPTRSATLRMQGGMMGTMAEAVLDGKTLDARALAQRRFFWALNGVAGMPDEPFLDLARGESVRLRLVNDTRWPHGMHLHGHHFRRVDGNAPGPFRDTLLLEPERNAEIAFVADNPGDWLLHCHTLGHSASGMKTWIRVA